MKSHLPIVLTAVAVVAAFAISYFTSRSLQSPETLLNLEIDERIEKAQRMLDGYEPAGERLVRAVDAAATQPMKLLSEDQWQQHLNYAPFKEQMHKQGDRLDRLTREFVQLTGQSPGPTPARAQTSDQLKRDLEENQRRIEDALTIVQQAVHMSRQAGDTVIRGTSHPVATRLEAILLYHKADLLRRRAAIYQASADAQRARLNRARDAWRKIETILEALGPDRPESLPGKVPIGPGPGQPVAGPGPAAEEPRPRSLLGKLLDRLSRNSRTGPADTEETPRQSPAPSEPAEPELAEPEHAPTLAERLVRLHAEREKVAAQIDQARADAARLSADLSALEQKRAAAQDAADQARQRMTALERSDLDLADPESLERFTAQYRAASKRYREASREMTTLAGGSIEQAQAEPDDKAGGKSLPQRGQIAVRRGELSATQARAEALEGVLAAMDAQIEEIRQRQQGVGQRYDRLRAAQAAARAEAVQAARAAIVAAVKAEKLLTEAADVLTGPGREAAQNAENAARKRISDATALKRQHPQAQNPRLDLITRGRFIVGHARTIEADIEYLHAQILAQQAHDLHRHHQMLREVEEMGITDEADLVPDLPVGKVPDRYLRSAAARSASEQTREDAIQAARAALDLYGQAEDDLDRLWVVHANRAAVTYLLANLHSGPQAQQYRDEAIRMYEQSMRDRRDRPEAQLYQRVIDGLTQVAP